MTTSAPKIIILTHCFPSNSSDIPGNFLYDLCISLKSLGVEVTVMTQKMSADCDKDFLDRSGAEIVYFDWKGGSERFSGLKFNSFRSLFSIISLITCGRKKFKELLKKNDYDLVFNCWVVPSGLWSYGINKKNTNAVWALGSDVSVYGKKFLFRSILRRIINKTNHLFTNSLHNVDEIMRIFKRKSDVLFTGRKLPASKSQYSPGNILKLVFVGRLEKIKGPDLLISSLILSGIENFSLKIIGDGTMRNELEKIAASNQLSGKISFLGQKDGAEISDIVTESDYLIISSRSESMPVVFWEAMQTSTPVISTDVGDIKHYCDEYNVGRVCEVNEVSLGNLLSFVYNFRPLRETLSQNTKKISELANIDSSARVIGDLIKTL